MADSITNGHELLGDPAIERAANEEDVVVGNEIVRHRLTSRIIHWLVALFFIVALLTGLPIWSPVFGWMAALFGGLGVARWLHAWVGIAFAASILVMFVHWVRDMMLEKGEAGWLG